jgi:hypothetical protein
LQYQNRTYTNYKDFVNNSTEEDEKLRQTSMVYIHARSEKELDPRSVGTSAAFGEAPPIKLCGWQELAISCFKRFTR